MKALVVEHDLKGTLGEDYGVGNTQKKNVIMSMMLSTIQRSFSSKTLWKVGDHESTLDMGEKLKSLCLCRSPRWISFVIEEVIVPDRDEHVIALAGDHVDLVN